MSRHYSYDPELVSTVRGKAMSDILEVLNETKKAEKFGEYKKEMLLKLAGQVLPRLHAGRDDNEQLYPPSLLNGDTQNGLQKNNSNGETSEDEEKDS